jgi:hypothetical protein
MELGYEDALSQWSEIERFFAERDLYESRVLA